MEDDHVVREIVSNPAWSEAAARLCARAGFKCEYCDLDFLSSPVAYKQIQFDHIVPKHAGGDPDLLDNLAVVCRTCNVDWKSRWNPLPRASVGASRPDLIAICRAYVQEQQGRTSQEIQRLLGIIGSRSRSR